MNPNKLIFTFICILFFCIAFQSKPWEGQSKIVQTEIQKRIEQYRLKKAADCRKSAVRQAEIIVDSIIHQEVFLPLIDTISSPTRPPKPEKKEIGQADTSVVLKPLFEK